MENKRLDITAAAYISRQSYPESTVLEYAASNYDDAAPFLCIEGDMDALSSSSLDLEWINHEPGDKKNIDVETRRQCT